jgi:hypothetical protein
MLIALAICLGLRYNAQMNGTALATLHDGKRQVFVLFARGDKIYGANFAGVEQKCKENHCLRRDLRRGNWL